MNWTVPNTESLLRRLTKPKGKIDVVLDTDTYNELDDQFALSYMMKNSDKLNVKALYAAPFLNDKSVSPKDGMEKSYDEILKECTDENLFQYPSTVSYKLITRACYNRLTFTGDNRLVDIIANSTTSTSKLALLYAMMCQNLLVRDFMIDVIGEKFKSRVLSFDKTDVNHFFVQLISYMILQLPLHHQNHLFYS